MAMFKRKIQPKEFSREFTRSVSQTTQPSAQEVARLAYEFYLSRGGEHGHDQEDWLRAEETLRQQSTQTTARS